MKTCAKCLTNKELECFFKNKKSKDGLAVWCRDCSKIYSKEHRRNNLEKIATEKRVYYLNNKERINAKCKEYRQSNSEKVKSAKKKDYECNKEKILERQRGYNRANSEKIRREAKVRYQNKKGEILASQKKYEEKNKEKIKEYRKEYRKINKLRINAYVRNRKKTNPSYLIARRLRNQVCRVLKGEGKSSSTMELLGCPIEEFKNYFASKFTDGMTWEIFMSGGQIHIDHIRPCASFDLSDPAQQKVCFHYSNFQPLWAIDNLKKSDSYSV